MGREERIPLPGVGQAKEIAELGIRPSSKLWDLRQVMTFL